MRRQVDTPSRSGSGPRSTMALSVACWPSAIRAGRPGRGWSRRPPTPAALKRATQSRSVCRSIPAARAAASRLIPSSTLASAISRAATRPSRSRRARRRSCAASMSVRITSGAPIPCPPHRRAPNHAAKDGALHRRVSSSRGGYECCNAKYNSRIVSGCTWLRTAARSSPVGRTARATSGGRAARRSANGAAAQGRAREGVERGPLSLRQPVSRQRTRPAAR